MIKVITNKNDYIQLKDLYDTTFDSDATRFVNLFGKQYLVGTSFPFETHLVIKLTDVCNANCEFCIERNAQKNEDPDKLLVNLDKILFEMSRENILTSVALTGGEPTISPIFPDVCKILNKYNISFKSMHTNGSNLIKYKELIDNTLDYVNVSRHHYEHLLNTLHFNSRKISTDEQLKQFRNELTNCKLRMQCVTKYLNSIDDMLKYIDNYEYADSILFRNVILLEQDKEFCDKFLEFRNYAFNNFEFKEQSIRGTLIIDTYRYHNTDVGFTFTDNRKYHELRSKADPRFCIGFILHPDGTFCSSWDKNILLF